MKSKDNFRTRRDDGDDLGETNGGEKVTNKPAPEEVDYESEQTPPENEVYVNLEPDDINLEEEPLDVSAPDKHEA